MDKTRIATILIAVAALIVAGIALLRPSQIDQPPADNGNIVDNNGGSEQAPVRNVNVKANEVLKSPFVVKGEARGNWYFEASFPVRLEDANGNILARGYAQAQGEWMTTDFVPFESIELTFIKPATDTGTLVLEKDNPSGLPEHADEIKIPVRFR